MAFSSLFGTTTPWSPSSLSELLSFSQIEAANQAGASSPYADLLRKMGYNYVEGGRVPDSQDDPSGWFMGASERGDGAYNDPYANSLSNLYQRYDSETGNWSSDNSYSQALGGLGYIPADYGLGMWKTPETLQWFNQNYGTNFTDPMSYMNYLYGPGGTLINDPNHGQLYQLPEGRGIGDYINRPLSYEKSDWFDTVIPGAILGIAGAGLTGMLPGTTSIFGAGSPLSGLSNLFGDVPWGVNPTSSIGLDGLASSQGFLPGSFELGASGYGGTAAAGLGSAGAEFLSGGGMGFFDDILGNYFDDFIPGTFDGPGGAVVGDIAGITPSAGTPNWWDSLTSNPLGTLSNLQKILGGTSGSGLLGNNSLLGSAINTAPILAAINYAKNQSPFDTSRFESLYSQFDPSAQAFQYDTNTGLGREELTSSLARRGVSGSSFGDQSLTNYNTFRDLGRQSLLNQGIGTQAGLAGQILNSSIAERQMKNDLYGRALLALSGGISPRISGL